VGTLFSSLHAQDEGSAGEDAVVPDWRYEFQRKYETFRDHGTDWRLAGDFALTPEDGLILGGGAIRYRFGFRTFPYVSRMELLGSISLFTGRFRLAYDARWPALSRTLSLDLYTHFSQLEIRNFYGYGNDTFRDEGMEDDGFYRTASNELLVRSDLWYRLGQRSKAGAGLTVRHVNVKERSDRFLNETNANALGDNSTLASAGLSLVVDSRDHPYAPHSGIYFHASAHHFLEVLDNDSPFQNVAADLRWYLGDTLGTDVMLGLRAAGEKLFGEFPYFESAFLGGTGSLRGYPAQRFAGDASAFLSAELRCSVGRWKVLVPTEFGVFALADAGRVWVDGVSGGDVHMNAGGGIWAAPLSREAIFSVLIAGSKEGVFVSGGIGFGF
jgi:hypothetical protein